MALIKCKECGKEFSDMADACPNCGYKPKKTQIMQPINDVISSSYIEGLLLEGEYVVYKSRINGVILIRQTINIFLFCVFFYIALALLGVKDGTPFVVMVVIMWFSAIYRHRGTALAITNKRLICRCGFFFRNAFELNLDKIKTVELKGNIYSYLADCNDVKVVTDQDSEDIDCVADARIFQQKLLMECEKCKKQK